MKTTIYSILILSSVIMSNASRAQTVNWRTLQGHDHHILNLNGGWDYSATFGIGYGYKLNTALPVIVGAEFSVPSGAEVSDDFKAKVGGQAEIFRYNHISAALKVQGIYRRYQSEFVTLANFGSEFSATIGYFRPKWFAAAELGFDKAIVTRIRHSAVMEEYYPEIQSGWYIPSGGNFFYGLQVGYSLKSYDAYLKAGRTVTQDFKTTPALPLNLQLGFNKRF